MKRLTGKQKLTKPEKRQYYMKAWYETNCSFSVQATEMTDGIKRNLRKGYKVTLTSEGSIYLPMPK